MPKTKKNSPKTEKTKPRKSPKGHHTKKYPKTPKINKERKLPAKETHSTRETNKQAKATLEIPKKK